MDSFQLYTTGTATWLALQSIPLLIAPRLTLTLLQASVRDATDLETYLARATAYAQLTLALVTLLLSDAFAGAAFSLPPSEGKAQPSSKKPHATLILVLTTVYHAISALYAYARYMGPSGQAVLLLASAGSGLLAAMGGLVLLFGGERSRGSRWPFESVEQKARRKERRRGKRL